MEDFVFFPLSDELAPDSMRLDWLLKNSGAIFEKESDGYSLTLYVTSGDEMAQGVSGTFISRGQSQRDCIDAFLSKKAKRI